jgi:hypothetical protein
VRVGVKAAHGLRECQTHCGPTGDHDLVTFGQRAQIVHLGARNQIVLRPARCNSSCWRHHGHIAVRHRREMAAEDEVGRQDELPGAREVTRAIAALQSPARPVQATPLDAAVRTQMSRLSSSPWTPASEPANRRRRQQQELGRDVADGQGRRNAHVERQQRRTAIGRKISCSQAPTMVRGASPSCIR